MYGPTSAFRHLGRYSHDHDHAREHEGSALNHTQSPEEAGEQEDGFRRFLPRDVYISEEQHRVALDRFFRYYASWGGCAFLSSTVS